MGYLKFTICISIFFFSFPVWSSDQDSYYQRFFLQNSPFSEQKASSIAQIIREKNYYQNPIFWSEVSSHWGDKAQRKLLQLSLPELKKGNALIDTFKPEEIVWIIDPWNKILKKTSQEEWSHQLPGERIELTPFTKIEDRANYLSLLLEKRKTPTKVLISSGISSLTVRKALEDNPSLVRLGLVTWININGDLPPMKKTSTRGPASIKPLKIEEKNMRECEENLISSFEKTDQTTNVGIQTINLISSDQLKKLNASPIFFSGKLYLFSSKNLNNFWDKTID